MGDGCDGEPLPEEVGLTPEQAAAGLLREVLARLEMREQRRRQGLSPVPRNPDSKQALRRKARTAATRRRG